MNTIIPSLACAAMLCLGNAAQAGAVTFDPVDEQGGAIAGGPAPFDTITAQGFSFTLRNAAASPAILFAGDTFGAYASNGSNTLYAANNAMFSILSDGSGIFNIGSFELGGGNLAFLADPGSVEPWALEVSLLGTFADNSQMMASFAVDQTSSGLASFGVNWSNLVDLKFSATGDYSLDNIQLAHVPEPGTLPLAALALAGLTASSLRRRPPQPACAQA